MKITTEDVLLCASSSSTAFVLKNFCSSQWNHIAIAVMIKDGTITFDEGEPYAIEINTGTKNLSSGDKSYINVISLQELKIRYRKIAVRKLVDPPLNISSLTYDFINNNKKKRFTSDFLPFVSAWWGIALVDDMREDIFCSELAALYYVKIFGKSLKMIFNEKYDDKAQTYSPGIFCKSYDCSLRHFGEQFIIQDLNEQAIQTMSSPLILGVGLLCLIYHTLY
jgi:hypothetical protein